MIFRGKFRSRILILCVVALVTLFQDRENCNLAAIRPIFKKREMISNPGFSQITLKLQLLNFLPVIVTTRQKTSCPVSFCYLRVTLQFLSNTFCRGLMKTIQKLTSISLRSPTLIWKVWINYCPSMYGRRDTTQEKLTTFQLISK